MRRPALTLVPLRAKVLGADRHVEKKAGSRVGVERNGACDGEFLVWFSRREYVKIDAVKLVETVYFTDRKDQK